MIHVQGKEKCGGWGRGDGGGVGWGRRKGLRGLGDGGKGEKGGGRNFMQRIHPRDADLRGMVTRGKERAGDDLNPVPAQASSAAAGRRIEIGLDCRRGPAMGEELWWQG